MGAWTYSIIMLTFSLSCLSLVLLKIRTVVDRDFDKTIITWQGWQVGNQTFTDEELEKVDVQEIRELMAEGNDEALLLPDG